MEGLTVFNEIFDKDPPDPLNKTANDGAFHVAKLKANITVSSVISDMYDETDPKFTTFMTNKTAFQKKAKDLMICNGEFDALENGLKPLFIGYQQKIIGTYAPGTSAYKALYWITISEMFKSGIESKIGNVDQFLLVLEDYPSLVLIKTDLIAKKGLLLAKMDAKVLLDSQANALEVIARASQKIFCIQEQGNAGGLMQFYRETPYLCNQYYNVTDIKQYKETEGAKAKKDALIHEFAPNTITIATGVLLTPSCVPNIKNIGVEGVKLGSTYALGVKGPALFALPPGKYFRKNIKFIGAVNNSYLVVDTTGNTVPVKLRIEIK